jgi:hypothetical protein
MSRQQAKQTTTAYLANIFPRHFPRAETARKSA